MMVCLSSSVSYIHYVVYLIFIPHFSFSTGQTEGNVENRTAGSASVGGTQNQESQPESASTLGLHTASLLAETMYSTRQIVVEQAGALLSVSNIFQTLPGPVSYF